jgi:hypothetical protein
MFELKFSYRLTFRNEKDVAGVCAYHNIVLPQPAVLLLVIARKKVSKRTDEFHKPRLS